jgi:hypothetical protein
MANNSPLPFGPWPRGIVNSVDEHAVPMDGLVDAIDCNIDNDGFARTRKSYALVSDNAAYKYLFESGGQSYAVSQGFVGILGPDSFTTIHPVSEPVGWTELNDQPVFCDHSGVYAIDGPNATQLTLRGTLEDEDRYTLIDMPGGAKVSYWQGRLLVLRGRSLIWSEALDYGSHSPARNFVRFASPTFWMAPLPTGIFVGLRDNVVFLAGQDPAEFKLEIVAGPSCRGGAVVTDTRYFDPEQQAAGDVAIWFSDVGFVVGRDDGSVDYPQAENLKGIPVAPRNLAIIEDRIYAFPSEE